VARSVLALSVVPVESLCPQTGRTLPPDRNGPRRLEVIKTNLCRYPPALMVGFSGGRGGREKGGDHGGRPYWVVARTEVGV
jgi:hypothetical protein